MALQMTASDVTGSGLSPRGEVVDLAELCSRLEDRLLVEERELSELRDRGEDVSAQEVDWIRMLQRYERVCDLLRIRREDEHASAA
jgi:hypothetical protein